MVNGHPKLSTFFPSKQNSCNVLPPNPRNYERDQTFLGLTFLCVEFNDHQKLKLKKKDFKSIILQYFVVVEKSMIKMIKMTITWWIFRI